MRSYLRKQALYKQLPVLGAVNDNSKLYGHECGQSSACKRSFSPDQQDLLCDSVPEPWRVSILFPNIAGVCNVQARQASSRSTVDIRVLPATIRVLLMLLLTRAVGSQNTVLQILLERKIQFCKLCREVFTLCSNLYFFSV